MRYVCWIRREESFDTKTVGICLGRIIRLRREYLCRTLNCRQARCEDRWVKSWLVNIHDLELSDAAIKSWNCMLQDRIRPCEATCYRIPDILNQGWHVENVARRIYGQGCDVACRLCFNVECTWRCDWARIRWSCHCHRVNSSLIIIICLPLNCFSIQRRNPQYCRCDSTWIGQRIQTIRRWYKTWCYVGVLRIRNIV